MTNAGGHRPSWVSRMERVDWAKLDYAYGEATNESAGGRLNAIGSATAGLPVPARPWSGSLASELEHRQTAPTPVVDVDFLDEDEGRLQRLVQHVQQELAGTLDEGRLLLGRHRFALRRRS